ncbi:MAG: cell division protein FtsA [Candidatus Omnitrophota bacterium]
MNLTSLKLKKNRREFLFALDIGSKKLTLAAAPLDVLAGLGPIFVEAAPSRGIFKGVVNDLAALSNAVGKLLKKMETRCETKITHAGVSINGNYIQARHSIAAQALAERGMRSITRRDIENLNRQAKNLGLELDEILLHEYPQGYSIDRHNVTVNPAGLHGRRFEADLLLVCAPSGYCENITKAVEQTGVDVTDLAYSGMAAAEAVLTADEKQRGVVFVDIGDALTGVLVFKEGVVRRVNVLAFGGRNIGEIIANYCKIPLELADDIKMTAVEIGREISEAQEVMIKTEQDYRPFKKRELTALILPEIDRFIAMLKSVVFDNSAFIANGMPMVVTGGLSLLEGFLEKMERELGLSVKLGTTRSIADVPSTKTPAFAAAIGLLFLQRNARLQSVLLFQGEGKNKVEKALDYITHLYQDYF